jgi:hypothetical protein
MRSTGGSQVCHLRAASAAYSASRAQMLAGELPRGKPDYHVVMGRLGDFGPILARRGEAEIDVKHLPLTARSGKAG